MSYWLFFIYLLRPVDGTFASISKRSDFLSDFLFKTQAHIKFMSSRQMVKHEIIEVSSFKMQRISIFCFKINLIEECLCNLVINYRVSWRLITAGTSNRATVDVHTVAEFGASGISVAFPILSLQPLPEQMRQWAAFAHFAVSDMQPRSIEFAGKWKKKADKTIIKCLTGMLQ